MKEPNINYDHSAVYELSIKGNPSNSIRLNSCQVRNLGTGAAIHISNTLVTNINVNYYVIDSSEYREPEKMKSGHSAHINLIWSPIKNVNTGVEFMVLERVNVDDNSGVGKRLQFMAKYIF